MTPGPPLAERSLREFARRSGLPCGAWRHIWGDRNVKLREVRLRGVKQGHGEGQKGRWGAICDTWRLWRSRLRWGPGRIGDRFVRFEVLVKEPGGERLLFLKIVSRTGTEQHWLYERLSPRTAIELSRALSDGAARSW